MLTVKAIKYVTNLMMSGAFLLLDIFSGNNKAIFLNCGININICDHINLMNTNNMQAKPFINDLTVTSNMQLKV